MPTSSSGGRQARPTASNKRSYWPNSNSSSSANNTDANNNSSNSQSGRRDHHQSRFTSFQQRKLSANKTASVSSLSSKSSSSNNNNQQQKQSKLQQIRHISPPSSLASTSLALRNTMAERAAHEASSKSLADSTGVVGQYLHHPHHHHHNHHNHHNHHQHQEPQAMSLAGQMVLTGSNGNSSSNNNKQPNSLSSTTSLHVGASNVGKTASDSSVGASGGNGKINSFLVNNSQYGQSSSVAAIAKHSQSQVSLQPATKATSTGALHSLTNLTSRPTTPLSMKRTVNLKYVKTLIILLMAVDLLITVFVHQFSSQDHLSIWFTSYKLRFSFLNLIISSAWFIILIGAVLFDVYFILLISCLIHVASFALLLVLSIIHFTRRIDYNTVNLTSLLALLFSIIMLQVYLVVMAALTIYLTVAVRRRQKQSSRTNGSRSATRATRS